MKSEQGLKGRDLQEYVNMVADMENSIYLQKETIQRLSDRANMLGVPKQISEPPKPILCTYPNDKDSGFGGILTFLAIGIFAGIWGIHLLFSSSILGFLGGIFVCAICGAFILLAIVFTPTAIQEANNRESSSQEFENALKQHEVDMRKYREACRADNLRVAREKEQQQYICKDIDVANQHLTESQHVLNELYDAGIIYPKYRNMIMMNSIAEYLSSGRCNSLQGSDGAYNIIENEMRMDCLIVQMDQVLKKLDQISRNQYLLYSAIKEANATALRIAMSTNDLSAKMLDIAKNTPDYSERIKNLEQSSALTAYHTQRVDKELHYMNRMKYWAGEYQGTFFNRMPL